MWGKPLHNALNGQANRACTGLLETERVVLAN